MRNPKIAVLVLCTNEKRFLKGVLNSLLSQTYKNIEVYVLDNNSSDGTKEIITDNALRITNLKYLCFKNNLGYAKANNIGLKRAFDEGADFCLVLNCDTILKKNAITELIYSYQEKKGMNIKVGLLQPSIILANDIIKINTLGNAIHYLGFGYCQDFMKKYQSQKKDKEIISVSGAALLISKDYYTDIGNFDEAFFMTSEDEDLSWRGLLAGYHHFLSANSVISHYYQFGRHKLNKYREEKNRLMILLKNYSLKSLILLAPMLVVNELAMVLYSLFEGWLFLKLKTYWIVLINSKNILKNRKIIQKKRVVKDKILFSKFKATIHFKPVNSFVIINFANPIYWFYYRLIYIFI